MGKIFLIIYKLKRKKKTFEFNPPASETSEHLLPFSDINVLLSLSLSLLQVILGHITVTDSRERWEGEKNQKTNSDHSIFPYTVDATDATRFYLCGNHLFDKVITVNGQLTKKTILINFIKTYCICTVL